MEKYFVFLAIMLLAAGTACTGACTKDAECGFDFCNKTNNECQCRFGKDESDRKECNEPPSCTIVADCSVSSLQNCTNNKCKCNFGYRGGTSDCKLVNECLQDYECEDVLNAICVKGLCVCKHSLPEFGFDGTLTYCNSSSFKQCLNSNDCPYFQECSQHKCRCKYGSVQGSNGKYVCRPPNACEENHQCPEHSFCSRETWTCECEKQPAVQVDPNGEVSVCEKTSITAESIAGIIAGCVAVAILTLSVIVIVIVDKRRRERASRA